MKSEPLPVLPHAMILDAVKAALAEDLGRAGDITSAATIPADANANASFVARQPGVIAGLPLAEATFAAIDPHLRFETAVSDGETVDVGGVVARVEGNARSILAGERVALNYLCHLSGIATATAALVASVSHTNAKILDTRKTTPGLRAFEKYAVRCGGGTNHRIGLYDAVLIKDNHIAVAGGVAAAIRKARASVGTGKRIEVEVGSLAELAAAMAERPDIVMLDNMSLDEMRRAVRVAAGRAVTEASGNVTLDRVAGIAETGVDTISSGWITHSAPALDIALDVEIRASEPAKASD
jgi:nicotinate-nucleotide pyrophosphorylase (carboxylating)